MVTWRKRQPPARQSKRNGNSFLTPGQDTTRYIGKRETSDIQRRLPTPPLTIEREVANDNGTTQVEQCEITQEDVQVAQQEIKHAADKDENTQCQAIINAIRRLYSYEPYDGQRECLHYLIYQRTDLILIAKTSFGKIYGEEKLAHPYALSDVSPVLFQDKLIKKS